MEKSSFKKDQIDEDEQFLREMAKNLMGYRPKETLIEFKLVKHQKERIIEDGNAKLIKTIERVATNKDEIIKYLKRMIIDRGKFEAKLFGLVYVHEKELYEMIQNFLLVANESRALRGEAQQKDSAEKIKNHLKLVK